MVIDDLRSLRGQLLLIAALFCASVVLAVALATQRRLAESFLYEKYAALPAQLTKPAEAARRDQSQAESLTQLRDADFVSLYEDWMSQTEPSEAEPRVLCALAAPAVLARAERTLVCGNAQQRERALDFLQKSRRIEALPVLRRVSSWAQRTRLSELEQKTRGLISSIEQTIQ